MKFLTILACIIVVLYLLLIIILYVMQAKLIFNPGKLPKDFKFKLWSKDKEVFLNTPDGKRIHALFYAGIRTEVILYFHGNAGDLSGWQFVSEDFTKHGYNFMIVDYRGYGKSTGAISENGFYLDSEAAYEYLIHHGFAPENIIIYGRSIGTGVAVELAIRHRSKGLVLESPYSSLSTLATEKLPFFFTSLYLRFRFNNVQKIDRVESPVVFLHGSTDTLIPPSHTETLFKKRSGKKKKILVNGGSHNDLNAFPEYDHFLEEVLPGFFDGE